MALDTRNKRSSAIHISLPWRGLLPVADGTVAEEDRLHVAFLFSGFAAEEPPPGEPSEDTGSISRYGYSYTWDNF